MFVDHMSKKVIFYLITLTVFLIGGCFFPVMKTGDAPSHIFWRDESAPASQSARPDSKKTATTTIAFGGDVMLSRVVGQKMKENNDDAWPFREVAGIFSTADLAIINLESPFTKGGDHYVPTGSFSFDADPKAIEGLKLAGIDLVNLANNHFGNQGQAGMRDTFDVLMAGGIKFIGAGKDQEAARQGETVEINGVRFGFLGYGYPESLYVATKDSAGIVNLTEDSARDDILRMKKSADVVIVVMHAGTEYTASPDSQQQDFARLAIDAGADLVVGHHPHWVQSVEIYKGRPIIYSLGNLVFDQMWSKETQEGIIVVAGFVGSDLRELAISPVIIYDYGQPKSASGDPRARNIFGRLNLGESFSGLLPLKPQTPKEVE